MDLTYPDAVKVLEARGFGIRAELGRIEALAELLDHPERTYPTVHIAGTNGKSSTARMIAAVLAAHGLKTGVYTSPHLQSPRERFALVGPSDGELASDLMSPEGFAGALGYLLPFVEMVEAQRGETVTYFELTTAMAFEWMAQEAVAAGVYECGLGGSWDATNVIESEVAVLTHIAVDHERFLGSTSVENAREKVGIVGPGAEVVSANQDPDVLAVIEAKVREAGASLLLSGREFHVRSDAPAVGGRVVVVEGRRDFYAELFLPLYGAHQARNLALAIAACEAFLDRPLEGEALSAGLALLTSPGRMEVVRREPLVVLDGAHNPDAAAVLGSALEETFGERRRTFVVAIFQDKDVDGILERLLPYADRVIFTRIGGERPSADPERLAASAATRGLEVEVAPSLPEAVDRAISLSLADEVVVVTGSLHGVGEIRGHLLGPLP